LSELVLDLIGYSDIHHAPWGNGLTEDDLLKVEDLVLAECLSTKSDFYLFGGDMYLSKHPEGWIRDAADEKMVQKSKARLWGVYDVGNHDRDSKNMASYHALLHAKNFPEDLKYITVLDTRTRATIRTNGKRVDVHGIPAGHGHTLGMEPFLFDSEADFNICVFHDLMTGTRLGSGVPVRDGIPPELLDLPQFDLVLGGDNHVHQELPLKRVPGWYIGAPVQHNWGDSGQERGIMHLHLTKKNKNKQAKVEMRRIFPEAPKFVHLTAHMAPSGMSEFNPADFKNNVVKISVDGPRECLDSLDIPAIEVTLRNQYGARSVKMIVEPNSVFSAIIPEIINCKTPFDDWQTYLSSNKVEVGSLDKKRLLEMGLNMLKSLGA
jgi:DNA repair exonuclease SbcCD nuclease subunit